MSKRPSRGVSSGVGSPTRMAGRDGDLTIRKTKEGKILYVKEHGKWHPINTGVDVAQMKKDVDRLIRSVNTLRNDNNPYPTINALNIRKNVATDAVDPKITFTVAGTDIFTMGVDTNDSNSFVLAQSSALGTTNKFSMTTAGAITLASPLKVSSGGTGATSLTDGGVLLGDGTGAIVAMNALGDGEMLVGDGTTDPSIESGTTLRTSIGVAIGTDVQAYDAQLDSLSALTAAEVGYLDGTVAGTLTASKTLVVDANKRVNEILATTVEVGSGSGTAVIQSSGDHTLQLQTGDSAQSTIKIADGTNGDIEIVPIGTGKIKTSSAIGFTHVTTDGGGTGDVADVPIDFATSGNKYRLTFTGGTQTFTNVQLVFPVGISGNFTLIVKTHSSVSTNAITNYPVYNGTTGSDATVDAVVWPGGAKPTITNTAAKADIISFYWDSNAQAAYGVITQNFSV